MAYMSQEKKKSLAPAIKAILAKHGIKGSIAVRHHSTLVLNIKSGKINFEKDSTAGNFNSQVNPYWFHEHFTGKSKKFLTEVIAAMNNGNWDKSDSMTDYFNVGWYIDVNIGSWNKPYVLVK